MAATAAAILLAVAAFAGGAAYGITQRPTVCIVVHDNGAPAPASCSDPNAYQVTP